MEAPAKCQDELLVAVCKSCAMVRVNGRGTFKAGPSLKRFGASAIEKGCSQIILDMEGCLGMDSTFMGVLAGLALRIQRETGGRLIAMNLTPKTAALLQTLGLDRLVECYQADELPGELKASLAEVLDLKDLSLEGTDKRLSLETMLTAHQTLVEVAPENQARFRDVLTYLDQDLADLDG